MISVRIWFVIRTNSVWYNFGEIFSRMKCFKFLGLFKCNSIECKENNLENPPHKKYDIWQSEKICNMTDFNFQTIWLAAPYRMVNYMCRICVWYSGTEDLINSPLDNSLLIGLTKLSPALNLMIYLFNIAQLPRFYYNSIIWRQKMGRGWCSAIFTTDIFLPMKAYM